MNQSEVIIVKKVFAIIVMLGCILGLCSLAGCKKQNDDIELETEEVVTQIVEDESADGEQNDYSQEIIIP